jgi:uncharacterized protein (TIGR03435 family)
MKSGNRFLTGFYLLMMWICCACAMGQATAVTEGSGVHGFDVVSIRVNKTGSDVVQLTPTANGYELVNVSLRRLLSIAYNLREDQISDVPGWARSARFDIVAKVTNLDPGRQGILTWPQRQKYLADVLVERFHLASHTDTRIQPVFRLVPAPGGQKLKHSAVSGDTDGGTNKEAQPRGDIILTDRFMRGDAVPISLFTKNLQFVLKRDVIDETGCTGLYDISLQWVPLEAPNPSPDDPDIRSALFTALHEQLGLRLVAGKGPVQTLVVDHVNMPSTN